MRLAGIMPWDRIEEIYIQSLSDESGRSALSSRITLGTIFINAYDHLTDERTVERIQKNLYMQFFLGLHKFHGEPLFGPSMIHREVA